MAAIAHLSDDVLHLQAHVQCCESQLVLLRLSRLSFKILRVNMAEAAASLYQYLIYSCTRLLPAETNQSAPDNYTCHVELLFWTLFQLQTTVHRRRLASHCAGHMIMQTQRHTCVGCL